MEIGGDDSWGAPVHKGYLIDSCKDIHFEFIMKKCIEDLTLIKN
ncbi:MAG TPA: hypothetical protein VIM42_09755 [Clostridium sp.]